MKPIAVRLSQPGAVEAAERTRAARAIQSIRLKAARDGTDRLTTREIDAEIAAARRANTKRLQRTGHG